jgi:hypothetical protein
MSESILSPDPKALKRTPKGRFVKRTPALTGVSDQQGNPAGPLEPDSVAKAPLQAKKLAPAPTVPSSDLDPLSKELAASLPLVKQPEPTPTAATGTQEAPKDNPMLGLGLAAGLAVLAIGAVWFLSGGRTKAPTLPVEGF